MVRHVTRPCPCMTTSIIIKITRVISMWTPHWITVSCHGVEGPMTTGYYCAIFPFCGGGKKKTKKRKAFYDWPTSGIPVISPKFLVNVILCAQPHNPWHHLQENNTQTLWLVQDIQMLWYDWCEIHTLMRQSDWCEMFRNAAIWLARATYHSIR